jgi:hypothetical protein
MPLDATCSETTKMQQQIHDEIAIISTCNSLYISVIAKNLNGLTVIFFINAHMAAQRGCDKKTVQNSL